MADDEAYWQSQHLLANEEGGPVTAVSTTTRSSGFPVVTGPDGEVVTEEALRLIWQERWRGAFDQADENGDGRIDRRELGKALIIAGMNPRSALFDQILDGMGGAELDFGEFARLAEDARAAGGGAGGGGATWEALARDMHRRFSPVEQVNAGGDLLAAAEPTRATFEGARRAQENYARVMADEKSSCCARCGAGLCYAVTWTLAFGVLLGYLFLIGYQLYVGAKNTEAFNRVANLPAGAPPRPAFVPCGKPLNVYLLTNGAVSAVVFFFILVAPRCRRPNPRCAFGMNILTFILLLFSLGWLCWGSALVYNSGTWTGGWGRGDGGWEVGGGCTRCTGCVCVGGGGGGRGPF
jgi:hypothetical protein